MDSLTQAALGSLCGEVTLRKQLGWKGIAWGFFFGTLPDLDILAYPWLEPLDRLSWHRGLSHSILAIILGSLIFGYLLSKLHRKSDVSLSQASWFVFFTLSTHVLIDCFTTYGTQILEPFSTTRVSLNNMAIIDLSFTLPMLLALFAVVFLKRDSKRRTLIGRCAVFWLCFYTALSFYFKNLANSYFEKRLADDGIAAERMISAPTISNIFLWRMLAESDGHFYITYWSFFDDQDRHDVIEKIPAGQEQLGEFAKSPEAQELIWFSQGWHQVIPVKDDPDSLMVVDMRFTESHTPEHKTPIFGWHLKRTGDEFEFHNVSFRKGMEIKKTLNFLGQRISGDAPNWMDGAWPWEAQ